MAGSQWYFVANGKQRGPVTSKDLRKLARAHVLSPTHLVWKDGLEEWIPAKRVKGLFTSSRKGDPQRRGSIRKPVRDSSNSNRFLEQLDKAVQEERQYPVVEETTFLPGKTDDDEESSEEVSEQPIKVFVPAEPEPKRKRRRKSPEFDNDGYAYHETSILTTLDLKRRSLEGKEAGFWRRFGAMLLDGVFAGMITSTLFIPYLLFLFALFPKIIQFNNREPQISVYALMLFVVPLDLIRIIYFCCPVASTLRGTFGKFILGIEVTDLNGNQVTFSTVFVRQFIRTIPATLSCLLIWLHPLWMIPLSIAGFISFFGNFLFFLTPQKQTLGDMISGTIVIRKS